MLIGSIDQITEKIQILREKYAFSYFVISDTCLETFRANCRSTNWKISSLAQHNNDYSILCEDRLAARLASSGSEKNVASMRSCMYPLK